MFMYAATLEILLTEHTYMPKMAIESAIRNYGKTRTRFTVKSVKPGFHHYVVVPVSGGFMVRATETSLSA